MHATITLMQSVQRRTNPALIVLVLLTVGVALPVSSVHGQPYRGRQSQEPDNARDLQVLGILYLQENQPAEAIRVLLRAIDLNPENGETHMWLGAAYFFYRDFEEAEDSLLRALVHNPRLAEAHNYLGLLWYTQGDPDRAITEFEVALEDPGFPPASRWRVHLNLGNIYLECDEPDVALRHLRQAIGLGVRDNDPGFQPLHVQLGKALVQLARPGEAVAALDKILAINPDHVEAHFVIGLAYRDTGELGSAREHLQRVVRLAPGSEFSERAQALLSRLPG